MKREHPRASGVLRIQIAAVAFFLSASPLFAGEQLAEGIQDNSFFVEEAYNQEAGVVQHILVAGSSVNQVRGPDDRDATMAFTQEWPLFSQAHQLSYTVPYSFLSTAEGTESGVGDILLNYRYQALFESGDVPAFAPRISLILPAGDADRGLGDGSVGYQVNLPFSKVLSKRWSSHFNAGATWMPDVHDEKPMNLTLAGSFIYAVTRNLNLMIEAVGAWDQEIEDDGQSSRQFSAIVAPGIRYAFNLPDSVQIVAGVAAPIGLTGDAPDYGILLYLSVEHALPKTKAR